jgi:hypothetical protein
MGKGFLAAALVAFMIAPVVATSEAQSVPTADLAIVSKTASVRHAKVGQQVTFTILATNKGPQAAELDVSERALVGLQMVSEQCDRGISPDTPSCEYGTVQPGETVTTVVVAEVEATESKHVTNEACVSSEETIDDPNTSNDCLTTSVRVIGKRK